MTSPVKQASPIKYNGGIAIISRLAGGLVIAIFVLSTQVDAAAHASFYDIHGRRLRSLF